MQIHEENNDFGKMIDEKMEAAQADTMKWLMPPSLLAAYQHCNMLLSGKFRYGEDYNEFEKSFIQDYAHDVLDMIWIFAVAGEETFTATMSDDEAAPMSRWFAAYTIILLNLARKTGYFTAYTKMTATVTDVHNDIDLSSISNMNQMDIAAKALEFQSEEFTEKMKRINAELIPLYIAHPLFNHLPKVIALDKETVGHIKNNIEGCVSDEQLRRRLLIPARYDWKKYVCDMRDLTVKILENTYTREDLTRLHRNIPSYEIEYDETEIGNLEFHMKLVDELEELIRPIKELVDVAVKSNNNRVKLNVGLILNQVIFSGLTFDRGLSNEHLSEFGNKIHPVLENIEKMRSTLGIFDETGNIIDGIKIE